MNEKPTASYRQVKDEILRRIRDREWQLGQLIPGEVELAAQFGCARATVNRALRELAEAGVVDRKRRAGTRVCADPVRQGRIDIPIVRLEIELQGDVYRYTMLEQERITAPNWLRARLNLNPDQGVLHVQCLHLASNRPYQFEDRWINLSTVPDAAEADFSSIGPNEWLVREVPYTDGEISFSAVLADDEQAALLCLTKGSAIFVAERMTWLGPGPVTFARMIYPPDYRVTTRF